MKVKLFSFLSFIFLVSVLMFYSCRTGPHNPYIDSKEKPSGTILKGNQRVQQKAKKLNTRQLRKTKRRLYSY